MRHQGHEVQAGPGAEGPFPGHRSVSVFLSQMLTEQGSGERAGERGIQSVGLVAPVPPAAAHFFRRRLGRGRGPKCFNMGGSLLPRLCPETLHKPGLICTHTAVGEARPRPRGAQGMDALSTPQGPTCCNSSGQPCLLGAPCVGPCSGLTECMASADSPLHPRWAMRGPVHCRVSREALTLVVRAGGRWGDPELRAEGPAGAWRGEGAWKAPLKQTRAQAGHQLAPLLSQGGTTSGLRATLSSCFPLPCAGPLRAPFPPPCPMASPQPESDMAFVFMPHCSLSGIKASVPGNRQAGGPQGQLWEVRQGSRLFSTSAATFLCHLPCAQAPHHREVAGAAGRSVSLRSPLLGGGGNRAENVLPGEALRRPDRGP